MSLSGNCRDFVNRLNFPEDSIIELTVNSFVPKLNDEKYILIVPTYDPPLTDVLFDFLDENVSNNCIGIIGSGNRNFGEVGYIYTAKDLSKKYNIPVIYDFEYAGLESDIQSVTQILKKQEAF